MRVFFMAGRSAIRAVVPVEQRKMASCAKISHGGFFLYVEEFGKMQMTVAEIQALLRSADEDEFLALERSLVADTRKGVINALKAARKRLDEENAEVRRIESLYEFERTAAGVGQDAVIVGLDEVGRGSLAGPLAVGAVVLPASPRIPGLNDSKQVKPELRQALSDRIKEIALAWTVHYIEPGDIDRDGMSASLRRAFAGALAEIEAEGVAVDVVLIDGNPLHMDKREVNVVKGDAKCASIAAASIVAKATRDALMCDLAQSYPDYSFEVNKGYSSPHHIEAIRAKGLSAIHRRSFCRSFMQESLF